MPPTPPDQTAAIIANETEAKINQKADAERQQGNPPLVDPCPRDTERGIREGGGEKAAELL